VFVLNQMANMDVKHLVFVLNKMDTMYVIIVCMY